jgi:GNAT superfamily N-acetyltransferase
MAFWRAVGYVEYALTPLQALGLFLWRYGTPALYADLQSFPSAATTLTVPPLFRSPTRRVVVDADVRGHGIGRQLFEAAEKWADPPDFAENYEPKWSP